jgi:hypothetical protein
MLLDCCLRTHYHGNVYAESLLSNERIFCLHCSGFRASCHSMLTNALYRIYCRHDIVITHRNRTQIPTKLSYNIQFINVLFLNVHPMITSIWSKHFVIFRNNKKFWEVLIAYFPFTAVWIFDTSRKKLWPSLWSNGQSFWLQIQRSWVRFPALPDFLTSRGSGTGSTQPRDHNWGATWTKK